MYMLAHPPAMPANVAMFVAMNQPFPLWMFPINVIKTPKLQKLDIATAVRNLQEGANNAAV